LTRHPGLLSKLFAILIVSNATPVNYRSVRRASDILIRLQKARDKEAIAELGKSSKLGVKANRNLVKGRLVASIAKKQQAAQRRSQWRRMSADLRRAHPGWNLDDHAAHIQGLPSGRPGGKPYAPRTIKDAIKGVRSEFSLTSGQIHARRA
jgi:hypothetical protein